LDLQRNPLEFLLHDLVLHSNLQEEDRQILLGLPLRVRKLDAAAYLVREGSIPVNCCVLVSGFAFRQKVTGSGSRQILSISIPGDPVDFQALFLDVSDHSVQMLTAGTVADIPRELLQQAVLNHPNLAAAVIRIALVEASIMREWVVNIGRRDARERIAHILCEFAVRLESRGLATSESFELPMTQEQLADATGLTPVHVNRVLKGLESEGLISRKRRHIEFTDWRRLQDVGDFSRQYLHLEAEDVLHQTA
jgi:CRP-like cAMP-binding protein